MFCGLCRKGVATTEGISRSSIRARKEAAEKCVLAGLWLGFAGVQCAVFFLGEDGLLLATGACVAIVLVWIRATRTLPGSTRMLMRISANGRV